jgi:hypothetical protein
MSGQAIGPLRWLRILKKLVIGGEAEVNLESGAVLKLGGTALTATGAQLNEAGTFFAATDMTGAEAEELTDGSTTAKHEHALAAGANDVTATAAEVNYLDNDDLAAADLQKLADLTATAAQVNSLVQFPGLLAYGVLRVAANVADEETVTIGVDVYEFDRAADGVAAAGAIAVTGHADDTPEHATNALIAAINASGTEAVTAVDISNNQVLVVADAPGAVVLALATDMQGVDNGWDAAAMHDGAAAGLKRTVRVAHVPNAVEVALDRVLVPLGFAPTAAIVQVRVTATGAPLAWSGTTILRTVEQRIDLINAGDANDFSADHTITVIAFE